MDHDLVQKASNVTKHIKTRTVDTSSIACKQGNGFLGNFADCNEKTRSFCELLVPVVPIKSVVSGLPLVLVVSSKRVKPIIRRFQGITVPTSRCPKHLFQWGNCSR